MTRNCHRGLPVRTSNAWTLPGAASMRVGESEPSGVVEDAPTITTSRHTCGTPAHEYLVASGPRPVLRLTRPRGGVVAPAQGVVTDLRVDVGNFAQAGAPVMTLVATHDLWISADMTENNLGHIDPGDEAAIVLDVMPGEVIKGRIRSVGGGVGTGQSSPPGTLPTVQNNRDWLRQAQRIPVIVEFDRSETPRLAKARVGGQADVLVYTGRHPVLNALGTLYIHVMSWVSYLY